MGGGVHPEALQGLAGFLIVALNFLATRVLLAVAFLVFLWGVYKYFILGASNESEKGEGRQFVLWAIIGFVAIFSIWGLVGVLAGTFSLPLGGGPSNQGITTPSL